MKSAKMDDFDVFTDEINYTKPFCKNILNLFVNNVCTTPSGPNYHCGRKLLAGEALASENEFECAFQLSEAMLATLRTMAIYRDEQMKSNDDSLRKITSFIKPIKKITEDNPVLTGDDELMNLLTKDEDVVKILEKYELNETEPFHKKYMRFGTHNNVDNLKRILDELPKEWTIIQLTAPYNPNENLKSFEQYKMEIPSILLTLFTNDYLKDAPLTVNIPANVTKVGEEPLFKELHSIMEENYKTIDNAQYLNNKRLVQNYWHRREDVDLRMKSVINVMDKEWLGGYTSLLTGKLVDKTLRERVEKLVDNTITDWGFIKLTNKQKILLYNLIECSSNLASQQIRTGIRKILTEQGNYEEMRTVLDSDCQTCTKEFTYPSELCLQCLSKCFQKIHLFNLVDGIKAFSQAAKIVRENDEWSVLKKAKRYPVILIVDSLLDPFPWEMLPAILHHPVSRMENIHFLYDLYSVHKDKIIDGYFMTKTDVGRYVINPEKNLDRMEKRMSAFVKYWCENWSGEIGETPTPEQFLKHLQEADIFLFCGHGDGCRLGAGAGGGAGVEAARRGVGGGGGGGGGVCALSGCGSGRLLHPPGRGAPTAAHQHLHVAHCPLVIGMLWEVTDLEIDKVVTMLLALCVPCEHRPPWQSVGKARWSDGIIDPPANTENKCQVTPERDILMAMSKARSFTNFLMIASSVVARGLPAKVES